MIEIKPNFRIFLHYLYPYFSFAAVPILRRFIFKGVSLKILPFEFYELLFISLIVTAAALKTKNFNLKISRNKIIVCEGVLNRRETAIENNKNIIWVIKTDPVRRIFATETLEIYLPKPKSGKPFLHIPINARKFQKTEKELAKFEKISVPRSGARSAAVTALGASSAAAGLAIAVPLANRLGALLGHTVSSFFLPHSPQEAVLKLKSILSISFKIPALLLAAGYIISFLKIFESSFGAKLFRCGNIFVLKTGFLSRRYAVLDENGVVAVAARLGVPLLLLGGGYTSLETLSCGLKSRFKCLISVNMGNLVPKPPPKQVSVSLSQKSRWRKCRADLIISGCFYAGFAAFSVLFPRLLLLSQICFFASAFFLLSAAVKYRMYFGQFISLGSEISFGAAGRLAVFTAHIKIGKVASLTFSQNCFDKKFGVSRVRFVVGGEKQKYPEIGFLNSKETAEKLNTRFNLRDLKK